MNAYLQRLTDLLGDRDPLDVLRTTPTHLQAILDDPRFDAGHPWRPGGWDGRAILAHFADQEVVTAYRVRQTVAAHRADAEPYVAQGYDPGAWSADYAGMDPALAVASFAGLRAWNLAWFARLDLHGWLAAYAAPSGDETTIDAFVRRVAGHDLHHLEHLGAILDG